MSFSIKKIFGTLAAFLVLLSTACDPCTEPGTIEIDRLDSSFPDLYWQVTSFSRTTGGGIASSLVLLSGDVESYTMSTNERVEILLIAEDNQSGILSMDMEGGFGITCSNPNGANAYSGIIPSSPVFYDFAEGDCALAEGEFPSFNIDGTTLCSGDTPTLTQGGYELRGSATNSVGLIKGSILQITVAPDAGI